MQLHPRTISRILELNNWFGTMMANLQLRSLQYATGPGSLRFFKYVHQPQSRDKQEMCTHQIIRQNDFASFNVLGLAIIFVVGGLIIVLNFVTEHCCEQNTTGHAEGAIPHQEWDINGTLKLQRLAFQHHGANFGTAARDPASSDS
jgi:hypothetical protein